MTFTVTTAKPKFKKWEPIISAELERWVNTPEGKRMMDEVAKAFEKKIYNRLLFGK